MNKTVVPEELNALLNKYGAASERNVTDPNAPRKTTAKKARMTLLINHASEIDAKDQTTIDANMDIIEALVDGRVAVEEVVTLYRDSATHVAETDAQHPDKRVITRDTVEILDHLGIPSLADIRRGVSVPDTMAEKANRVIQTYNDNKWNTAWRQAIQENRDELEWITNGHPTKYPMLTVYKDLDSDEEYIIETPVYTP